MSYADLNQCKGCACFTDDSHGGLVNGLCLDCRNPEQLEPLTVCPTCAAEDQRGLSFCSECGEFVSMTLKSCSSAGADAQVGQQSHLKTARADRAGVATGLHDPYQRTPQQEQELDVMRSRGEL